MITQFHILIFIITFYLVHRVQSDSLPPVYKHGCVILANQKIYCYGGANRQGNSGFSNQTLSWFDSEIYNHHVYLDVSKPLNVSAANTQWQPVSPPSSAFQLEPRSDFAMINHNDTGYTIVGGAGPSINHGDQSLVNITVDYNADLNTWGSIKRRDDQPKLNVSMEIQMFGTRGVKITNSQYMIAGGMPPNNNTVIQTNSSYVYVESADSNWGTMKVYSAPLTRGNDLLPEPSRVYRADVATSSNGDVYLFGGMLALNATENYDYMNPRGIYTFDTLYVFYPSQNQTFGLVKASNPDNAPSTRELHTVTSIPNTDKMLLYGGVTDDGANPDFCYTFDTVSGLWSVVNFTNGDGAGRRYGHQAVMVGNDLLYIIGGIDITNTVQNDVHILNVTSMTWLNGSYTNTYDQTNSASSSNNNNNNNGSGSSSLSGGAIAGIVIGCVAAVALGAAATVIFYMQHKKKKSLSSGAAPAGFAPTTPPPNNTKEYNMTNSSGPPANDGSTTLYASNPTDGTSGQAPTPGTCLIYCFDDKGWIVNARWKKRWKETNMVTICGSVGNESQVQSDPLFTAYKQGCVILANGKIRCYEDTNHDPVVSNQTLSRFNSKINNHHVYLGVYKPLNVSSANTQLQPIPSTSDLQLEPHCDSSMINHNDTSYTIVGGSIPSIHHDDLVGIPVDDNADSNSWESIKHKSTTESVLSTSMVTSTFSTRGVITGDIPPDDNIFIQSNASYVNVESNDPNWEIMETYIDHITRDGNKLPGRIKIKIFVFYQLATDST
ncbi:uncharacterized protein BX664DRAFT_318185 [Halteromyces radiatus]|uniref:uncharacterized protein n=1 Tax=Halteromyces radiatus TaxID=101107 RepID=UPI002220070F|nr:uncharacterized protein BX664DRAFT_318185 [Halteromyces radiatus]KAI8078846.1 hypothetical protein BX664DRAFT_318185 [Halteromyces radiatus]